MKFVLATFLALASVSSFAGTVDCIVRSSNDWIHSQFSIDKTDGKVIVIGNNKFGYIQLVDSASGTRIGLITESGEIIDGNPLFAANADGSVKVRKSYALPEKGETKKFKYKYGIIQHRTAYFECTNNL